MTDDQMMHVAWMRIAEELRAEAARLRPGDQMPSIGGYRQGGGRKPSDGRPRLPDADG